MKTVSGFVAVTVLFTGLILMVGHTLDRPIVQISMETGKCVKAEGPHGPMSCDQAMSMGHDTMPVSLHNNR